MEPILCFGIPLKGIEYEIISPYLYLCIDGKFKGRYPENMPPLQAYCHYIEHGRLMHAEYEALKVLRKSEVNLWNN